MNWRRGLLRLWVVLTLVWAGITFMDMRPDKDAALYIRLHKAVGMLDRQLAATEGDLITIPTNNTVESRSEVEGDLEKLRPAHAATRTKLVRYVATIAIPSVAALLIGLMLLWVLAGFQRKASQ